MVLLATIQTKSKQIRWKKKKKKKEIKIHTTTQLQTWVLNFIVHIKKIHTRVSKPHPERRSISEHFSCGNTLQLIKLEKLIKIFLVSKSSKLHQERRTIAEYLCRGNAQPLLIKLEKLIQISVLISVQVRPIQGWEVCEIF